MRRLNLIVASCAILASNLLSGQTAYIYDAEGEKIFFREKGNVAYVKRDGGKYMQAKAADAMYARLKAVSANVEVSDEYYRLRLDDGAKMPDNIVYGKELLYEPDSTVQWASNEIFVQPKDTGRLDDILRKNGVQYSSYRHFGSLEDEYVVTLIGGARYRRQTGCTKQEISSMPLPVSTGRSA